MITLTMTDYGNKATTMILKSLSELKGVLDRFNTEYTVAYIDIDGRQYKAWRFLSYRVWYSSEPSLELQHPEPDNTFEHWIRHERELCGG